MFSNKPAITIQDSAWQHQIDRMARQEERIADLETVMKATTETYSKRITDLEDKLKAMDKRLAAIEAMLGSDNLFRPADAGRDDTYSLFTPLEE